MSSNADAQKFVGSKTRVVDLKGATVFPGFADAHQHLSGVGFLDSTAIRKLFGLASRLAERRQRLVLVTPEDSTVRRTLQLVEFSRAAPMHATLDDALGALGIAYDARMTGRPVHRKPPRQRGFSVVSR